ncbi:autism susceptibility gene 2 protein homolog isoform X1 [Glandiceps talaboti]
MESDAKQRSQRHKRRERAAEMKQQQKQQNHNAIGSGDDDEMETPLRERERSRHRHKRRRSSSSHEEDIIDGFAISSFCTLGALEQDGIRKMSNRNWDKYTGRGLENGTEPKFHKPRQGRKIRSPHSKCTSDENTRPEETNGLTSSSRDRLSDASSHSSSGKGYICDSESEEDRASDAGSDLFRASPSLNRREPGFNIKPPPLQVSDTNNRDEPPITENSRPTLNSTNSEPPEKERLGGSIALSRPPNWSSGTTTTSIVTSKSSISSTTGNTVPTTTTCTVTPSYSTPPQRHSNPSVSYSLPSSISNSHPPRYSHSPALAPQPPHSSNSHNMFAQPLPPPPPLTSTALPLPATPNTQFANESSLSYQAAQQDLLRQELNTRFLASQDRSANIPPPPYMRTEIHSHQHMHQHQHQHTHSFMPAPPSLVPTPAPHMLGLPYPGISPMTGPVSTPGAVTPGGPPFTSGSYGAFQPKLALAEGLLRRRPSDQSGQSSRPAIQKPGRWCAAHVNVAWHIYHQQQKEKAADVHKDNLVKNDLFARPTTHMFPTLHRPHDLVCPTSSLIHNAAGAAGPPNPFASGGHPGSFLGPGAGPLGMPPFPRPLGYTAGFGLGGLGNGLLNNRDMSSLHALGSPHDAWNRLHRTPPSFPTAPPPWPGMKADAEREREALTAAAAAANEADRERRIHELERLESRSSVSNDRDSTRQREDHQSERSSVHSDNGSEKIAEKDKKRAMNSSQDKISEIDPGVGEKSRPLESPSRHAKDAEMKPSSSVYNSKQNDSAFENVQNKGIVKNEEKEEDNDIMIVGAAENNAQSEPSRTRVTPTLSISDRSRMIPPFGMMTHPPERLTLHPHAGAWDPIRNPFPRSFDFPREQLLVRPDIREYERERMMRSLHQSLSTHHPLAPFMEQERYREREPHDFTRDNPLLMDLSRRGDLDHLPHYAEERERLREDTLAAERNRLLHGGDHLHVRPSLFMPSSLPFPNNATLKSSSSLPSSIPPPLVSTVSLSSTVNKPIVTQTVPASTSSANHQDRDSLLDPKEKSSTSSSEKDSQLR